MGHQFLKHIARTSILIHIIDPLRPNPVENFKKIQRELELFDKKLAKKPLIVAINKIDSVQPKEIEKIAAKLKEALPKLKVKIFAISAVTGENLKELMFEGLKVLKKTKKKAVKKTPKIKETIIVLKPHEKLVKFKIEKTKKTKKNKYFTVTGKRIEQLVTMTDTNNLQGLERLYHFFNKMGITKALKREKAQNGDIIKIANKEIPYRE